MRAYNQLTLQADSQSAELPFSLTTPFDYKLVSADSSAGSLFEFGNCAEIGPSEISLGATQGNLLVSEISTAVIIDVPEPSSWMMMLLRFCGFAVLSRRTTRRDGIKAIHTTRRGLFRSEPQNCL